jgi:hypothetical protein
VAGVLALAAEARSSDVWEIAGDDSAAETTNLLRPGIVQAGHDLSGSAAAPDQDWMRLVLKTGHSYEVRISGVYWRNVPSAPRPILEMVEADGTVLGTGQATADDILLDSETSIGRSLRFIMTSGGDTLYVRASGPAGVATDNTNYSVALYDTTLFVPRWNNSGTQTTVLVIQNATHYGVFGSVHFRDAAGTLIASPPFSIPASGVHVMSTASVPALAGQAGSALIVHTGPHGGLVGKAVALESATGFTFDTPFVYAPR